MVINRKAVSPKLLRRYRAEGAEPVEPGLDEIEGMGLRYVLGDLLQEGAAVRHDQSRLTRILLDKFVENGSAR